MLMLNSTTVFNFFDSKRFSMKLKSTFKLILFSLFLNSPGVLAADNSAVLGQWVLDMFVQGEKVPINLTIAEDGDELGGT